MGSFNSNLGSTYIDPEGTKYTAEGKLSPSEVGVHIKVDESKKNINVIRTYIILGVNFFFVN